MNRYKDTSRQARTRDQSLESTATEPEPERCEITGRPNGKSYLVLAGVILALLVFLLLPILLHSVTTHKNSLALLSGVGAVAMVGILVYLAVRYRCFQVKMDAQGFYLRTTPFNGQYYRYTDIKECREVRRVYRPRGAQGSRAPHSYAFLFFFTDGSGVTRQFFFQKERFSHEIQVLKARIAAAQNQDVQEPTRPTASPRTRTAASSKVPPLPLLLLGIVLLGIGLYLLSPHIVAMLRLNPQNNSWTQTTATVVNVSTQGDSYNIVYSYTVNGASYQNSTTSDTSMRLGDTISVYYNPASPQFSRDSIGGGTGETVPISKTLLGALSTALGLGCVGVVAWSLKKPATAPAKVRRDSNRTTR